MQDTKMIKSNKEGALMKAAKNHRNPKIQNPECEKTSAGKKN